VIALHAVLGTLVEILGIYLVLRWVLHRIDTKFCFGRKLLMKITFVLWLAELLLGVYGYFLLYPRV